MKKHLFPIIVSKIGNNKITFFISVLLLTIAITLQVVVHFRYQDFIHSQNLLGKQSVESASNEIQRYIENRRHLIDLYAKVENKSIAKLADNPDDKNHYQNMFKKLHEYVNEAHNYTVADIFGKLLLSDKDNKIGKGCRKDILAYASGEKINKVFIHSNPEPSGYHFDVLTDVNIDNGFNGIFFVSINTTVISSFLKNFQQPGHQLILTRSKKGKSLVELTENGPRPMLERNKYLSDKESTATLYAHKIPNTYWTLRDIPSSTLFSDRLHSLALQAISIWLIFFLICIIMLWRVSVETRQRKQAENALIYAKDQLQSTVEERTLELQNSHDKLYQQATHDSLTGLINRQQFDRNLEHLINQYDNYPAVLAYLDLDQFKLINDSCGHMAGDELLKQVVTLVHKCMRESDDIGRLGGDEFGVILYKCPLDKAVTIMEGVIETLKETPFHWENKLFNINVSIGLTTITENTKNTTELLRQADLACYVAKDQGRGRIHIYSGQNSESSKRNQELNWLSDIPNMISNNRLMLYVQPIIDLTNTKQSQQYYEVLLRLKDTDGKTISPTALIPAAERYNLMSSMDKWVIENAFQFLDDTNKNDHSPSLHFAINISANSINNDTFITFIKDQQSKYNILPQNITFEITETAAISNLTHAKEFIRKLKIMGFQFSLDDFGTGVASFEYLKQLPVDVLKIDGSFIKKIANDRVNQALVQAMTQAAHALGKITIAECVEDDASVQTIKKLGVDYGQGYYYSVPVEINSISTVQIHSHNISQM